jgi:hypothetical protein
MSVQQTVSQDTAWPHKRDFVILVNPARRRKVIRHAVAWVVLAVAAFELAGPDGLAAQWTRQKDAEASIAKLQPVMSRLADEGKPDAIRWMVENVPGTDLHRLDPLVEKGDAQAMFALASREWKTDRPVAEQLVARAAEAGYAPAIKFQWRMKQPAGNGSSQASE